MDSQRVFCPNLPCPVSTSTKAQRYMLALTPCCILATREARPQICRTGTLVLAACACVR
jgi:hypothetical protein